MSENGPAFIPNIPMFSSVDKHGLEGNVCDFFVCKPPAGLECKVVQKFRRSTCFPIPPLSFLVCYQIREWNLTKPYLSREFYTFLWFVLEQQINISNVGFSVLINSRGMSNVWWERVQKGQRASLIFQRIVHLFQGNKEKIKRTKHICWFYYINYISEPSKLLIWFVLNI